MSYSALNHQAGTCKMHSCKCTRRSDAAIGGTVPRRRATKRSLPQLVDHVNVPAGVQGLPAVGGSTDGEIAVQATALL